MEQKQQVATFPEPSTEDIIDTSLELAELVSTWHGENLTALQEALAMPEGTVVEMQDQGFALTLTGETLDAYQAGLLTAFYLFEQLPFNVNDSDFISDDDDFSDATPFH